MWPCPKCREEIDDSFDVCWACGTSREGVEDTAFKPEPDQPDPTTSPTQHVTLRGFKAGAGVAALMALLHPYLMLLLGYLATPAPVGLGGFLVFALPFGLLWAAFAAVGGGIAVQ